VVRDLAALLRQRIADEVNGVVTGAVPRRARSLKDDAQALPHPTGGLGLRRLDLGQHG